MKVTFLSNYINHHQLPFCREMIKYLDDQFVFIQTEPMEQERRDMNWGCGGDGMQFVWSSYESKEVYERCIDLVNESDIVIIGSAPEEMIRDRLENNRIIFRYSERIFKWGLHSMLSPAIIRYMNQRHRKYRKKQVYLLCASAYLPCDMGFYGAYPNKMFKWGYFTEAFHYDMEELFQRKQHDRLEIVWCARFLPWKHPEMAVWLAERLKSAGEDFHMTMIGIGELKDTILANIKNKKLEDKITILGSMPPAEVRKYMEAANLFLFTSDYQEGWGAVAGEAMNSGCAVVASHAAGSVPYLIHHGENGLIYRNGNKMDLYRQVMKLIKEPSLCRRLGEKAYETMTTVWSPQNAAGRLLELFESILRGGDLKLPEEGPCSRARVIHQWNMYRYVKRG